MSSMYKCQGRELLKDRPSRRDILVEKVTISDYTKPKGGKASLLKEKSKWKGLLGRDLSEGYETFQPVSLDDLNDMKPLCEGSGDSNAKVIALRHVLRKLFMVPFTKEDCRFICTVYKGKVYLSEDPKYRILTGINDKNEKLRKICYTGFGFEDVMTEGDGSFYVISEGKLHNGIELRFAAEIDAVDTEGEFYELKSMVNINTQSVHHLVKLMNVWSQCAFIGCDNIIVGFRDPYSHELCKIIHYTRKDILKKLASGGPKFKDRYSFRPEVGIIWFERVINWIVGTLLHTESSDGVFRFACTSDFQLSLDPIDNTRHEEYFDKVR